jgi:hypothetical protein
MRVLEVYNMKKNQVFQEKIRQKRSIVKRSLTTALPKNTKKLSYDNASKLIPKTETLLEFPPIDPIIFQLQIKQTPKIIKYNIKRLNNSTLLYKTDNGMFRCRFDPSNLGKSRSHKSFSTFAQENSDQLVLSTENALHDLYNQSIRLQNMIKKKEKEKKLDFGAFCNFSYKLSSINQSIVKEQSRISRSFYSM